VPGCYASANDLSGIFAYLKFHYGFPHTGVADGILAGQGFAPVPRNPANPGGDLTTWVGNIAQLVTVSAPMQVGPAAPCTIGD
jgi:hypothetical protein